MAFIFSFMAIVASIFSYFSFKKILFCNIRLNGWVKEELEVIVMNNIFFIIEGTIDTYPFSAIVKYCNIYFYYEVSERILKAGQQGSEYVCEVTILRFNYKKFVSVINSFENNNVPVYIMDYWRPIKVNEIKSIEYYEVFDNLPFQDIEQMVNNETKGFGLLFYGEPGNGKSFIVRYLAYKYKMPVYIANFPPECNNTDILICFQKIPKNTSCIVLFEDFDNYFNKRKSTVKDSKHSFDIFLNIIDGVYFDNTNILFIMTTNRLDMIDESFKERPSRFRYVIEIGKPDDIVKKKVLGKYKYLLGETCDMTLDQVINLKYCEILKHKSF